MLVLLVLPPRGDPRPSADAAEPSEWRLVAPHGRLTAQIVFAGDGAPLQATVLRKRRPVLSATIGLGTVDGCLPAGFKFARGRRATISERYRTAAGKRRLHRPPRPPARAQVRAAQVDPDGGAGARRRRLRLPHDAARSDAPARSPASAARSPRRPAAVHGCSATTASYEGLYIPTPLSDAAPGPIGFPALLQSEATWVLLSESRTRPRPGRLAPRAAARPARPAGRRAAATVRRAPARSAPPGAWR